MVYSTVVSRTRPSRSCAATKLSVSSNINSDPDAGQEMRGCGCGNRRIICTSHRITSRVAWPCFMSTRSEGGIVQVVVTWDLAQAHDKPCRHETPSPNMAGVLGIQLVSPGAGAAYFSTPRRDGERLWLEPMPVPPEEAPPQVAARYMDDTVLTEGRPTRQR